MLLAAIGEDPCGAVGVMNLGIEGMMLISAASGFWVTSETESLALGMLVGILAATLLATVHAVLAVSLHVNQIISGLALVIIGTGMSGFLGDATTPKLTGRAPRCSILECLPGRHDRSTDRRPTCLRP